MQYTLRSVLTEPESVAMMLLCRAGENVNSFSCVRPFCRVNDASALLRPVSSADQEFLFQVYASTRADEMAIVPWTPEQKQAFVQMQYNAQRQSYAMQFPEAEYSVIHKQAIPIGRLIVARSKEEMRLMDIALLPGYRNQGMGTQLIRELMAEAAASKKPLRLHVEFFNPARRLYERLGFRQIAEFGIYFEMEWVPVLV